MVMMMCVSFFFRLEENLRAADCGGSLVMAFCVCVFGFWTELENWLEARRLQRSSHGSFPHPGHKIPEIDLHCLQMSPNMIERRTSKEQRNE